MNPAKLRPAASPATLASPPNAVLIAARIASSVLLKSKFQIWEPKLTAAVIAVPPMPAKVNPPTETYALLTSFLTKALRPRPERPPAIAPAGVGLTTRNRLN
ncbi:MAG: hypothetical protein WCD53_29560 [Microcoleus sp.]